MSQPTPPPPPPYGTPGYGPPPGYGQPPASQPGPPSGYPSPGFTAPYAPLPPVGVAPLLPQAPRSATLGVIALVVAIVGVVGATVVSAVAGFAAADGAARHAIGLSPTGLENFGTEELLGLLSPVRDLVLWAEIGFWAGTVLGIWALVQGIFAIVQRRGRGQGIAAVVIAAIGPFLFGGIVYAAVIAGVSVGAMQG